MPVHQHGRVGEGDALVPELLVDLVGEPFLQRAVGVPAGQRETDRDRVGVGAAGVGQHAEDEVQGEQGLAGARFAGNGQTSGAQALVVGDDVGEVAVRGGAGCVVRGLDALMEGHIDAMSAGPDQLGALSGLGRGHGGSQRFGLCVSIRCGLAAVVTVGRPGQVGARQGGGQGDQRGVQPRHLGLLGQPQRQRHGGDLQDYVDEGRPGGFAIVA
ncbi:hypothetical protein OG485_43725 [Streptomyces sp. NBC_00328]|nr:hypothetical protein [Streptomyces sp. NBC_00328]